MDGGAAQLARGVVGNREGLTVSTPVDVLRAGTPVTGVPLGQLQFALESPAGWPSRSDLELAARGLGFSAPTAWGPGRVVLVSCSRDRRASLWVTDELEEAHALALGNAAVRTSALAFRLALREAPALMGVLPGQPHSVFASLIGTCGPGVDRTLDGTSFGLGLVVMHLSRVLGLPVRPDVCASVVIRPDGTTDEVNNLDRKMEIVATHALGVETFVVAKRQLGDATDIATTLSQRYGRALTVVAVSTVAEALERPLFFGRPLVDLLADRWTDERHLGLAAAGLFDLATRGSSAVVAWTGVARAAERIASHPLTDGVAARKAEVARLIAGRHSGRVDVEIPCDDAWLSAIRSRLIRTRVMAHIVQSHTDACSGSWRDVVEMAASPEYLATEGDEGPDDLKLVGAIARAYAAWGDHHVAIEWCLRALRGWCAILEPQDASYALTEAYRIASVHPLAQDDRAQIEAVFEEFVRSPSSAEVSRRYVDEARARASLADGKLDEALAILEQPVGTWPRDLEARWLRSKASTLVAASRPVEAEVVRAQLERLGRTAVLLSRLDAELEGGADSAATLAELRATEQSGRYVERILGYTRGSSAAKAVATHYPY